MKKIFSLIIGLFLFLSLGFYFQLFITKVAAADTSFLVALSANHSNVHTGKGECNTTADCPPGKECYCDPDPNDNIADGWCYKPGSIVFCPPGTNKTLNDILEEVLNYIFLIAMALAPLMIIISGLYFVFSGGDPQKVANAKRIFFYAIVGLVIALLAKAIIGIIKIMFGG